MKMSMPLISQPVTVEEPLYERVLGDDWRLVDPAIRNAHLSGNRISAMGTVRVSIGDSFFPRFMRRVLGLPASGEHAAIVRVTRRGSAEIWVRLFGMRHVKTKQEILEQGVITERFRWMAFTIAVKRCEQSINYQSTAARFRVGPLTFPMPRFFQPKIEAVESAGAMGNHVDVSVFFPGNRSLISYVGDFSWCSE